MSCERWTCLSQLSLQLGNTRSFQGVCSTLCVESPSSLFTVCDPMALLPCITHLLGVIAAHLHHLCKCSPRLDLRWEWPLPSLCLRQAMPLLPEFQPKKCERRSATPSIVPPASLIEIRKCAVRVLVEWSFKAARLGRAVATAAT